MKKIIIIMICYGFVLSGCYTLNTAYDVTRYTIEYQDDTILYFEGPTINQCKLTFGATYAEFRFWVLDKPSGFYVLDESGDKFRLHYKNSLEDENHYILLTKEYLLDRTKTGLCFKQNKIEYKLPGFYVEGFLNRLPAWVQ